MILAILKTMKVTALLAVKSHKRQRAIIEALSGIIETLVVITANSDWESKSEALDMISSIAEDFAVALEKI